MVDETKAMHCIPYQIVTADDSWLLCNFEKVFTGFEPIEKMNTRSAKFSSNDGPNFFWDDLYFHHGPCVDWLTRTLQ